MGKRESGSRLLMSIAALLVVSSMVFAQPKEQTFTILGANGSVGDVDPYTDCSSDGGVTWHEAYLTGWHPWGFASGTNSWISIDPNNAVGINGEHDFRIRFYVPEDFTDPSMVFVIKADNAADVWVNDTYITHVEGTFTYAAGDAVIAEALVPGVNEIRLHLIDWGGIVGMNYRIDVTMTSAEDLSDPIYTPEEADEIESGPTSVLVDIKPDSDNNRVNPNNNGVVPVAVLTTDEFDATTIDVASLSFGPNGASTAHDGHFEDVDNDGDVDLMLHFPTQDIGFDLSETEYWLTGTANDGEYEIEGSDFVSFTGGGKGGNGRGRNSEGSGDVVLSALPTELSLAQNFPNPFNPTTNISYTIPEAGLVNLTVFNVNGEVVGQLVNGFQSSGNHSIEFNASELSSGTYFYVLKASGQQQIKQMSFIK